MRITAIITLTMASLAVSGPTVRQAGSRYPSKAECQAHLFDVWLSILGLISTCAVSGSLILLQCPSDTTPKCIQAIIGAYVLSSEFDTVPNSSC